MPVKSDSYHLSHFGEVIKSDEEKFYHLTHPQMRQVITENTYPDTPFGNLSFTVKFKGDVDFEKLEAAINKTIYRNDGLRLRIVSKDYDVKQYISPYIDRKFDFFDFSSAYGGERRDKWLAEVIKKPFKFYDSDLFYFALVKFSQEESGFYLKMHHIISDGWSIALVIDEIIDTYKKLRSGASVEDEKKPSYVDFISYEDDYLKSLQFDEDKKFWNDKFSQIPEDINLNIHKAKEINIEAKHDTFAIPPDIGKEIYDFCERQNTTFFRLFMGVIYGYLNRVTSFNDITVGMLNHNRSTSSQKQMTGMFVSTFPLRLAVDSDQKFQDFLATAEGELRNILKNRQKYPYDILINDLREKNDRVPNLLNIILAGQEKIFYDDIEIKYHHSGYEQPPYNLLMNVFYNRESPRGLEIQFVYPKGMFEKEEIERIYGHLLNMLEDLVKNPDKKISQINILSEEEKDLLLNKFNDTAADYPKNVTVIELFKEQVRKHPDKTAVVFKDKKLTYSQLDKKSDSLGALLRSKGVKPDQIVGIMLEPGYEMILGPLAILKSGAAFMPIDPKFADDRIKFMMEDSDSKILLTQKHFFQRLGNFGAEIIDIGEENISSEKSALDIISKPRDLAYIIYTSGSTGKPKGVMIEHACLANFSFWSMESTDLTSEDRISKYAGFAFDASIIEIFPPLVAGAEIYIVDYDIRFSPKHLNEYFEAHGITKSFLPTQFMEQFMDMVDNKSLKLVETGGDKLKHFKPTNYTILNIYGPTEYTVCTTSFKVDKFYDNIPIGKPLANTHVYILDKNRKLQPVGVSGELCIAGAGLSRGYLNRPELTAEKFVDNPFEAGSKMYRTGDLARWLPDGNIEFLGRIDFQVKIRGFRVELGEIESRLLQYDGISESIAVAREDAGGNKYLCAYFVAENNIDITNLRDFLREELPEYMIPSFLIQLEKMPLNPSGKIDRKSLPEPEMSREIDLPTNGIEEKMAEIWRKILNLEKIGINENFFALGGHSLKAVLMQAEIEKTFAVEISFNDILDSPTIKQIGEIIKSARKVNLTAIEPAPARDFYPVTSAQKRLFFIEQMKGVGTTYNIPLILEIEGNLNKEKLSKSIDQLIQRHESLRTSFEIAEGDPVQIIHDKIKYRRVYREIAEKDLDEVIKNFVTPFNLLKPPLFRMELLRISPQKHILMLDIHHTIFDGSSMVIFVQELAQLYDGENLTPLRIQYKDFALWQSRLLQSESIAKQEQYWLDSLGGVLPVIDMPTDFSRPSIMDYVGDRFSYIIDAETTKMLKNLSVKTGTTLNMVLMAAYYVLLARYSSQEDIVIGMGSAGRNHIDIQRTIGMFVNSLPLRGLPEDEKSFEDFLREIKENFLKALENQDYPLDYIVEKLKIKRDSSRNPLFDVAYVMQSMGFPKIELKDIKITPHQFDHKIAHVDLMLEIIEDENTLLTNWEYRTSLFKKETMERIGGHFKNILKDILENPKKKIKDINLLSGEEENRILCEFNQTAAEYPRDLAVHQIFEEQVAKYPDRIAVSLGDESLTYRQLNQQANQLARFLRGRGVTPDSIVAIMLEKSLKMIVGLIGIIKAGGCYLPIKPDFPVDRINYMLENSGTKILLTTLDYKEKADDYQGEIIDFVQESIYTGDDSNLENTNSPEDLIYIIYTSGSTGKPKGVMLKHKNIVRLFKNDHFNRDENYYNFDENDVWSMFHSFCFDFSVWEMYGALLYGGKMVVIPKHVSVNPQEFLKVLKKEKVTVLSQTPGAFYNLIEEDLKTDDHDLSIRYVTFGGEALKPGMLKAWHQKYPETKLINMYGITETTVHVTYKEIGDKEIEAKISNIGVPIPTLTTYLMDRNQKLVPIGVPGEICVGGDGLARGYLGRQDLTDKVFISNPYKTGEMIYKSGDLAKLLPNGEMEYLGRIDFQVKIRGFRIELGEIENQLLKHESVNKAVVIAKDDAEGNKYLVSYLVLDKDLTVSQLREHILKDLPDYMIPSYFVNLKEMPLTPNGKVDRKALPDPDKKIETGADYVASRSEAERKLVEAWQKVLKVDKIGVLDNFFALGGHSLKAVTLVAELQKDFEVSVNDIFECQTIAKLAQKIKPRKDDLKSRILEIKKLGDSSEEKREKFLQRDDISLRMEKYHDNNEKYETLDYDGIKKYDNVLLTGATGYLGIHILFHLMDSKNCCVYTVVRGKNQQDAENRLRHKCEYYFGGEFYEKYGGRIKILQGDLGADNLGLPKEVYGELIGKIDAIIHSAANVRHYGHYQEFYQSNVQATLNLLTLAKTGKNKDVHHVSTLSVFEGCVEGEKYMAYCEDDFDLGQKNDNYYVKTKFEAEEAIFAARRDGINTSIYRVGNISINSQTGLLQENIEENAFFLQVKSFVNLGVVPESEDEVEFAFVDYLSKAIVLLFDRNDLQNETYHLLNSNMVKLSDILTSSELNINISKIPFPQFIDFLYDNYDKESFKKYIESIMLHRGWLSQLADRTKKIEDQNTNLILLSDRTNTILEHLHFEWPRLNVKNLTSMIIAALKERIEFLTSMPLFARLANEEISEIARISREVIFDDEGDILWEGDLNDNFYIIMDGNVELSRHSKTGWLGTLGLIGAGDFIGEENVVSPKPSSVSAQALLGDVTVLKLKGENLKLLIRKNPDLGLGFLENMSQRLEKLQRMMVNIG